MSLKSDLIQALIDLATAAGSRVYDEQVPQGAPLPFCALTEISATRPTTISGAGLLKRSTIRIAIFTRNAVDRESISTAITNAYTVPPFKGALGDTVVSSVRVETSSDEVALSDGDNVIKGKGLDLIFVYY
jgi:hypothetical protein